MWSDDSTRVFRDSTNYVMNAATKIIIKEARKLEMR